MLPRDGYEVVLKVRLQQCMVSVRVDECLSQSIALLAKILDDIPLSETSPCTHVKYGVLTRIADGREKLVATCCQCSTTYLTLLAISLNLGTNCENTTQHPTIQHRYRY
mmetsp:Transcript_157/g.358  ORF Transcript_157/g.358 Transcript_157/m.358 type:complete len:109 (-) Transcript_157:3324-3650(-)